MPFQAPQVCTKTVCCYSKLLPSLPPSSGEAHRCKEATLCKALHTVVCSYTQAHTVPSVPPYRSLSALSENLAAAVPVQAHRHR